MLIKYFYNVLRSYNKTLSVIRKPSFYRQNKIRTLRSCVLAFTSLSVSGCGLSAFSFREDNPIIQDYTMLFRPGEIQTFATKASHRLVLMRKTTNTVKDQNTGENIEVNNTDICSEPPPDVAETIATALAGTLSAKIAEATPGGPTASGEGMAQYARAVSTQIAPLLYRTQGLQLYRDESTRLCLDWMNNLISLDQYNKARTDSFNVASKIIEIEIPLMLDAQKEFFKNVKSEGQINVDDLAKIIQAQTPNATKATKEEPKKED